MYLQIIATLRYVFAHPKGVDSKNNSKETEQIKAEHDRIVVLGSLGFVRIKHSNKEILHIVPELLAEMHARNI